MQTYIQGDTVRIKFEVRMAGMLYTIDTKLHHNFVVVNKGKKVLYTKLQKLLYGNLKA